MGCSIGRYHFDFTISIFYIQDLTKHTHFWLQYGWRSKEGWTSDFETKVYWSYWSNVQCSYTFLATFVSLSHFKLNCVKLCKRAKSFCPLCQIVKTFKSSFCSVRSTGWLRGHITQLRKFKSFMQVLHPSSIFCCLEKLDSFFGLYFQAKLSIHFLSYHSSSNSLIVFLLGFMRDFPEGGILRSHFEVFWDVIEKS